MTRLKKTIAALLAAACLTAMVPAAAAAETRTFSDAPADAPYAAAVSYVVEQGLMGGTSGTTFEPNGPLTRAALATVLYRSVGSPAVYGSAGFTDVRPGQWYSDAVTWANGAGVMQGYGDGSFGRSDPVTQEQLTVLLARFQGKDAAWTGDPALAATVTRAQVAQALEQANITGTSELVIAKQGMFSSGGTVTQPVEGAYDAQYHHL